MSRVRARPGRLSWTTSIIWRSLLVEEMSLNNFSGVRDENSIAIHQWCARYYLFDSVELWRRLQWSDSQVGQQHITFCWWKTNIKYSIYFLSYYSQEGDLQPPFLRSCSQGFFWANCNGILVSGGCQVLSFSLWGAVPWDQVYECLHPFTLRFQIGFQGNQFH